MSDTLTAAERSRRVGQAPFRHQNDHYRTPSTTTRICNQLRIVDMCTSQVALMDLDRGTLARIDRKVLSALGGGESYRMVRLPISEMLWFAWKRYCDAAAMPIGRTVVALIVHELRSVVDEPIDPSAPVLAESREEQLADRGSQADAPEHCLEAAEARLRNWTQELGITTRRGFRSKRPVRGGWSEGRPQRTLPLRLGL